MSAAFFLIIAVTTRGVGGGDIKLAALTGLANDSLALGWAGWNHLVAAILIGLSLAACYAIVLVMLVRASRRDHILLGPFLLAGALAGLLI